MAKQFIMFIVNHYQAFAYPINCANRASAEIICKGIYPDSQIVSVLEK